MKSRSLRDTTHLVIRGHEGWLDVSRVHYHPGAPVEVFFKWGHNMKPDGLCQKERLQAYLVDPEGIKENLNLYDHDDLSYALSFTPAKEGFYQVVVEQDGIVTVTVDGKYLLLPKKDCQFPLEAAAFTQYARAIIPVGHDLEGEVRPAGNALELAPLLWKTWRAGDRLRLHALFRGQPVAGVKITFVDGDSPDVGEPLVKETGEDGLVDFTLSESGRYLILARYVDETDAKEGYYDQRRFTATLPLLVTR